LRVATILIADPDPATWSLLELLVLRLGHRSIGPRELADDEKPDLMLLEPSSQLGLRQAQALRRRLPQLPILCVSIEPPSPEAIELGVVDYVMKPFRRAQLERAIERALTPAAGGHGGSANGGRPDTRAWGASGLSPASYS
jgi:DNA-binding response OmpR family regulator